MKRRSFRFNLLVNHPLQKKYLLFIIVAMIVPAVIVGSFLYYFIFTLAAEQIGIPEAVYGNLLPVVHKINTMLLIGLVPLFGLLLLWGLILSHRFCGPLYRIERDLDRILEGDHTVHFRVRENDGIKSIIDRLNRVADIVKGKNK